jgi:hypothetical protein
LKFITQCLATTISGLLCYFQAPIRSAYNARRVGELHSIVSALASSNNSLGIVHPQAGRVAGTSTTLNDALHLVPVAFPNVITASINMLGEQRRRHNMDLNAPGLMGEVAVELNKSGVLQTTPPIDSIA